MTIQCERAGIDFPPCPEGTSAFRHCLSVGYDELCVPSFFGDEEPHELSLLAYITIFYKVGVTRKLYLGSIFS